VWRRSCAGVGRRCSAGGGQGAVGAGGGPRGRCGGAGGGRGGGHQVWRCLCGSIGRRLSTTAPPPATTAPDLTPTFQHHRRRSVQVPRLLGTAVPHHHPQGRRRCRMARPALSAPHAVLPHLLPLQRRRHHRDDRRHPHAEGLLPLASVPRTPHPTDPATLLPTTVANTTHVLLHCPLARPAAAWLCDLWAAIDGGNAPPTTPDVIIAGDPTAWHLIRFESFNHFQIKSNQKRHGNPAMWTRTCGRGCGPSTSRRSGLLTAMSTTAAPLPRPRPSLLPPSTLPSWPCAPSSPPPTPHPQT